MKKFRTGLLMLFFSLAFACCFALAACGDKDMSSLNADTASVKTSYVKGEKLDLSGLKVSAVYADGDTRLLEENEYTVSPANGTVLNDVKSVTVTITYNKDESFNTTYRVSVHNNVQSISVKTQADKTEYWSGEEAFDAQGLEIEATYEDGTKSTVSIEEVEYNKELLITSDDENDEQQDVIFTYKGKTAKQTVTVKANPVMGIEKIADPRLVYMQGEVFDPAGIILANTYKSGTKKEIGSTELVSATYPTHRFTQEVGETVDVSFKWKEVSYTFTVTIVEGLAIEAEDGRIVSKSVKFATDAVKDDSKKGEWEDKYLASGGVYLAELNAGNTVSFDFVADKKGEVCIAFRMSSKYLKEDSNWVPVWMGDCQFNKIAKFYINDEEFTINDTVILPGGGSEGGSPNFYLWFNWVQVAFNNVPVNQGVNTITLEYVKHNYDDCSQASFNSSFSANIDCLKLVSSDVNVSLVPEIDKAEVASLELVEKDNATPELIFGLNVTQKNANILSLTDEEIIALLEENLKSSIGEISAITYSEGVASVTVSLNNVVISGVYSVKIGYGKSENVKLDVSAIDKASYDALEYTLENLGDNQISGVNLTVALNENARYEMAITLGTDARVEIIEDRVYYIVEGSSYTETIEGITVEELIDKLREVSFEDIVFDMQKAADPWNYIKGCEIISVKNGKFEIALDITDAGAGVYGTHLYLKSAKVGDGNFAPKLPDSSAIKVIEAQSVVYGINKYTVSFNSDSTWKCVNIKIETLFSANGVSASLAEEDGKAIYTVSGEYTLDPQVDGSSETSQAAIKAEIEAIVLNLQKNPYAAEGNWDGSWSVIYPELVKGSVTLDVVNKTYTVKYDITDLDNYHYSSHYFDGTPENGDFKPESAYENTITIGDKSYKMVVVPNTEDGALYWGCVGIIISSAS